MKAGGDDTSHGIKIVSVGAYRLFISTNCIDAVRYADEAMYRTRRISAQKQLKTRSCAQDFAANRAGRNVKIKIYV